MQSIRERFEFWWSMIDPDNEICQEQKREMKRSFYSGASSTFDLIADTEGMTGKCREHALTGAYTEVCLFFEMVRVGVE